MSDRRRLLLTLLNQGVWLPYSFEYLYHDLIPQTINGKNVKNKLKLATIYGNSEVRNQLISSILTSGTYNDLVVVVNNNSISVNGTANATTQLYLCASGNKVNLIANHTYLVYGLFTSSGSSTTFDFRVGTNIFYGNNAIFTPTSSSSENVYIVVRNGQQVNFTITPALIDLTQMFPFDTPTTLTDNRVQAILNRGYIPYNSGELKSVDIGEFSSTKADTTALQTIQFKYQGGGVGTSHDTMEITKDNVVFVKDRAKYTFTGSEGWAYGSSQQYFGLNISSLLGAKLPADSSSLGNDLCNALQQYSTTEAQNDTTKDMCFFITQAGYIGIRNTTYSDLTNFGSWINGKQFEYQLATTQVITIPRKKLGIYVINGTETFVDTIGSGTSMRIPEITNVKPSSNNVIGNIFWAKGLSTSINNIGTSNEYSIAVASSGSVYITTNKTRQQLQEDLIGSVIFYETETEVADIVDTIGVEAGGTFTSDSEVLPNVDTKIKGK